MNRSSFERNTITVPVNAILPTRALSAGLKYSPKFKTILASIQEVGIIEPLAVFPEKGGKGDDKKYILLDGHVRLECLKVLGTTYAVCLLSKDDEGFTFNRQINRLSAVQEHRMIMQAIAKKVPPERIAKALNVNVERIRARQRMLDGIAPEVVELLKDRLAARGVFPILRKMKPMRQIEAAEMMIAANRFTITYATMILSATRPELLLEPKKPKPLEASAEDIARMEREMDKLYQDYRSVQDTLGDTMLVLVVAKGYVSRLLKNDAIVDYLLRYHADLAGELEKVMAAIRADAMSFERE
ncbi:chromosome partitioning protein [Brucella sp. 10RB9210]|nr:plasmid partitioning protein RepB C-terminal domain-containing protein [Brucella sp. 10RB9210]APX67983.1 chromosome partitioning protein [Brucella sp. 09RB8471]MRN77235.1 chromosome partitioning protein [Brucella sp. 10RB9210]